MGVVGIYFFTRKMATKKPGLILDEQGIYDNATAFKFGLIPWSAISQVYERNVQTGISSKQQFITIVVVDPESYISRGNNFLKKKLLQANAKQYGSPIHISANGLTVNHNELLKLIGSFLEKEKMSINERT